MLKPLFQLIKPGIVGGNTLTALAGFFLALHAPLDGWLLAATLGGLAGIVGCGCALNQYLDRKMDRNMIRTQNRPLVTGTVSVSVAIAWGVACGVGGSALLFFCVNGTALLLALLGLFIYLVPYTLVKYRSTYGTLVGSIAGALPPIVGYAAVSPQLDSGALLLFCLMVVWQMPHFYAIALYRLRDYAAAAIPVLPLVLGSKVAKVHILCYTLALFFILPLFFLWGYVSIGYLWITLPVAAGWVRVSWQGFRATQEGKWARKSFLWSLAAINSICLAIPLTHL